MRRLIIVLAAASLVLAGCGGGGSSKPSAKPLTKAEYQTKLGRKITCSRPDAFVACSIFHFAP